MLSFSVVEKSCFKIILKVLNSEFKLFSKHFLVITILHDLYEETK